MSPVLVEPAATAMTNSTSTSAGSTSTPTSSSRTPPMAVYEPAESMEARANMKRGRAIRYKMVMMSPSMGRGQACMNRGRPAAMSTKLPRNTGDMARDTSPLPPSRTSHRRQSLARSR